VPFAGQVLILSLSMLIGFVKSFLEFQVLQWFFTLNKRDFFRHCRLYLNVIGRKSDIWDRCSSSSLPRPSLILSRHPQPSLPLVPFVLSHRENVISLVASLNLSWTVVSSSACSSSEVLSLLRERVSLGFADVFTGWLDCLVAILLPSACDPC